jgi:hypothetical protein
VLDFSVSLSQPPINHTKEKGEKDIMSTRIRTLQDLRDAAATQTQTQTASNPTRSEGRTPAGETTQATAGNDAAPKQVSYFNSTPQRPFKLC